MTAPQRHISAAGWPFDTVLIANRGEIALRILKTVEALDLKAVVIHHAVDSDAPAVRAASKAIEIKGATPVAAYLDGPQIIAAARAAGAGVIHPGYGFLSENAAFARAVADAGLTFIGPTPEVIELMGDKVRARAFVQKHGFPVAPSAIEDDDPMTFTERARAVGFPLLIKPSAGGGGKGMHIVRDASVLAEEIVRARSEGQRYFGDGRLYVERYIENPRHIEVQVLGDAHGNVVHLFERECSVQRRFQKIIEETPSPAMSASERARICETAAGIARAAGYRNAGTVEFIYGAGEFYFLEMNTRLQVEHPVTEMVTGIDLVREQLRVAANEPLGFTQADIATQGHAIECRIYAESPARGFAPTTGRALKIHDGRGPGLRLDIGVTEGQAITTAFDPMLAKLIVHGKDREEARQRALSALQQFVLLGCETNVSFLHRLVAHPAFREGDIHTGFLDAHPEIASEPVSAATLRRMLAIGALSVRPVRDAADDGPQPHNAMGGWRN
ncbi:biotin carboxylase N-terminal domain-containing protein [Bradyrhizobium sp. LHD-71]|uniref:acetyl-CoA carboxylase biotin carboxylase subunit n=1 Tax=Bradyrhizobium sp. LHD-71 TaxID=3072141 RepID=UPI00280C459E|nr:biotin carboxylase N-terminal domain-containing protein [Bradyrhizobium sp. LHD-71]MDQ8727480.1 biotin carboxylase N-terminal domain-containing protein [Bradyrhizobium sp. LHD-71]